MTTTPQFPGDDPALTGHSTDPHPGAAQMVSVPREPWEADDTVNEARADEAIAMADHAWTVAERAAVLAAQEHLDDLNLAPGDEHWAREHAEWMWQQDEYERRLGVALRDSAAAASLVSVGGAGARSRPAPAARVVRATGRGRSLGR